MLTPQHTSTKVDGEERHTRGEAIPDVSIKVSYCKARIPKSGEKTLQY